MRCDGMRSYFSCETTNWIENLTFSKADSKNPKNLCQKVGINPPIRKNKNNILISLARGHELCISLYLNFRLKH